jgi:hypothetical protein
MGAKWSRELALLLHEEKLRLLKSLVLEVKAETPQKLGSRSPRRTAQTQRYLM